MSCDPIWESIHRSRNWGAGYLPDFPGLIARRCTTGRNRVLEIGCGGGANVLYMAEVGLAVDGIDASQSAVDLCRSRLEERGLSARVLRMDALELADAFPPAAFDGIIDVRCLQHNRLSDQEAIISQVQDLLAPGGWAYSRTAMVGAWGDGLGTRVEEQTYTDVPTGPATGRGLIRFATADDMMRLWAWLNWEAHLLADNWLCGDETGLGWWREWIIEGVKRGESE